MFLHVFSFLQTLISKYPASMTLFCHKCSYVWL